MENDRGPVVPSRHSVNDGISPELCLLSYALVDDAVEHIRRLGCCTQLVKMDLRDAYRMVPIHPHDQSLLAISCICRPCLTIWPTVGTEVVLCCSRRDCLGNTLPGGARYQLHYLNDFLFLGSSFTDEAAATLSRVSHTFQQLGIPLASNKTEGPATFLGILIDMDAYELRLPLDKLTRLQALLNAWRSKKSCSKKELESLLGHSSHAARIPPWSFVSCSHSDQARLDIPAATIHTA